MENKIKNIHLSSAVTVSLITIVVYALTNNPLTKAYSLQMTLAALLLLIIFRFVKMRKDTSGKSFVQHNSLVYLTTLFVLFLIASTGWFFSPFFFLFYFLALGFAFLFGTVTSSAFVITLALLFSFNVGDVDLAYDFMVILSVLSVIPLGMYLKKQYLKLKEESKNILILQEEKKSYKNSIEEALSNKMHNFSAIMREPINDIKQFTYMIDEKTNQKDVREYSDKINLSLEKLFRTLKQFETEVTGKKHVSSEIKS